MKDVMIAASARTVDGKGGARRTRAEGRIPGVIYGPETEPKAVAVEEKEMRRAMKMGSGAGQIYTMAIDGVQTKVVLRDIQRDPLTTRALHIDFHAISMTRPINISIPIHFTGIAKGVKSEGGIMQVTQRELEIACLPVNIPDHFEVDVSELGIGDSIHVRDISIPNVKFLDELDQTIVVISAPTIIKSELPAAGAEGAVEGEVPAEGAAAAPGAAGAAPGAAGAAPAAAGAKPAAGAKLAAGAKPAAGGKTEEKKGEKKK